MTFFLAILCVVNCFWSAMVDIDNLISLKDDAKSSLHQILVHPAWGELLFQNNTTIGKFFQKFQSSS